jgi:catechol 2,3-dioxygenase-like lactoylglutathione lyase family enzyme
VIHHVGMSVSDLGESLAFWEAYTGHPARWRTMLEAPYLGRHVGYPGVRIDAAFVDLPGGGVLELLDYQDADEAPVAEASAAAGHVHLCLAVDDAGAAWERAVAAGARPVVAAGPIPVEAGPNRGARVAYLRVPPDGATLELYEPATPGSDTDG